LPRRSLAETETSMLSAISGLVSRELHPPLQGMDVMHENWPEMVVGLSSPLKELRAGIPEVMKSFSSLAHAATEARALDPKIKELIALGISVAVRCDACIAFHAESAVRQGATRDEVMETMGMAIYMGAGPSVMYAAQAVEAYDQFRTKVDAAKA
jgi:AhpD family alkylhydroperoxidase